MNAITTYNQTRNLLRGDETVTRFAEILGDKDRAQLFLASILSVVSQNEKLQECDPQSIMLAALKAAVLQLAVEPAIGHSFIIPYKGRATFQIGYKGIIQLALRTKQYVTINATEIYEGEEIKQNRLSGVIVLNGQRKSDKIIGYASYIEMKSGYKHYVYMTVEELNAYAKKYSPSFKYDDTLWHTNFDVMAKKTVLKQNLTKYGQISISILDDEDVIEGEFKSEPEVKVEAKDEPAAEPEKKPRKPKEEKEKQDEPFKSPDPVVSSMPPEPEEPPQVSVNSDQIYSFPKMLTANGYFRDEGIAKAALMWYKGPMEYEPVTTWAEQVKQNMSQGMPLAQAAKSVPQ